MLFEVETTGEANFSFFKEQLYKSVLYNPSLAQGGLDGSFQDVSLILCSRWE